MKRILLALVAVIFTVGLVAGCGGGDKKEKAANTKTAELPKKIVVGLDDNFPPMGYKDEKNQIVGFDIDMAKEASKRLGIEVEFKPIDWSSKEAELKSKRIDCIWNGLNITEDRKKNMLFSDPYMEAKQLIFIPKNSTIKGQEDLKGKIVGIQSASTAEINFENDKPFAQSIKEIKKYPDCIAAMMDMEAGRVEAIVTDEIVGRYYMEKKPGIFVCLDKPVGPVGAFGIAFRQEDTALRDKVQSVLNEMKKDGTSPKICEKWFGKNILQ